MKKLLFGLLFSAASAYAGTKLLAPTNMPHGTSLPATCAAGDYYQKTDATTGQQIFACESANTWVLQGDGGGSGGMTPSATYYVNVDPTGVQSGAFNMAGGSITANQGAYWVGTGGGGNSQLSVQFVPLPRSGGFGPQTQEGMLYFRGVQDSSLGSSFSVVAATVPQRSVGFGPSTINDGQYASFSLSPMGGSDTRGTAGVSVNGTNSWVMNDASSTFSGNMVLAAYNCSGNANDGKLTVDANGLVACADDISGGGGGGGTTVWVEDDQNSVNTAVSTISANGVLGSTTIAGGRVGVFLRYEDGHFTTSGSSLAIKTDIFATALSVSSTTLSQSSATATYIQQSTGTNGAGQLLRLDANADVPDANLSASVSLLGSQIDISAETNLAVTAPVVLTDDTLSVDTNILATAVSVSSNVTQLNSQFANYYSSGQAVNLFNLKTVDATTYATWQQVNMFVSNPSTIPFNVSIGSVTDDAYGSGWNSSTVVPTKNAIWDKIESMSAGSGIVATDSPTVSGLWTFLAPVEFRSTVSWTSTGGFDLQENATFLMPRGMSVSTYSTKSSLSYSMTNNAVYVGTGTESRMIAGQVIDTVFITTGTYTPHPRMVSVEVILTGPGGSGGECAATDSVASGGGGGGTAIRIFTKAEIGVSQAVGIPPGPAAGIVGSSSTFGTYMVAGPGDIGLPGTGGTVQLSTFAARGGNATGGTTNLQGAFGEVGRIATTIFGAGGNGGNSAYWNSGGGRGAFVDQVGNAGQQPGGGAGGCHAATATNRLGAAGGAGYARIREFLGG